MMQIFDTSQKRKIEFEPINKGQISMYVCGPTVYDRAHLGHGRSSVSFDFIRRYFLYKGYEVKFVSNYTDIDDKMITRAAEESITVRELAEKIIPFYKEDYGRLGVMESDVSPLATDHVTEMVNMIKRLEDEGLVYVIEDGVYFDIEKYGNYGKLSGQSLDELRMGSRVAVNDQKRNPYDFVLWKFRKPGEPYWQSPWGEGRPGWHIECSAMSFKHLGAKFDIHGGGLDLVFPHHECEVAQSHGALGEYSFARHWMHNGFVNVDNEKMSKSLGNFFTLKDIFEKYDPLVVRFMFLQTHYRGPINFSDALLDQAKAALMRIWDFVRRLERNVDGDGEVAEDVRRLVEDARVRVEWFLDDDFDSSGAMGVLFELVRQVNVLMDAGSLNPASAVFILSFLKKINSFFGFIFEVKDELDEKVKTLIDQRTEARANKDFKRSDAIRDELSAMGIVLEDTPDGTIWKKA